MPPSSAERKRFSPMKNAFFSGKNSASPLRKSISSLKIYIFNLKICISRLEIDISKPEIQNITDNRLLLADIPFFLANEPQRLPLRIML